MITPDLIIGMPIGFVGAAESKEALFSSGLVYITMLGRKGGTPATVAAINALMRIAGDA
jgi:precorrin-8X/cobalt-precorrin-8 methylmutase